MDVVYCHFGPSDLDIWQFDGWSENDDHRPQTPWGHTRPDYGRGEVRQFITVIYRPKIRKYDRMLTKKRDIRSGTTVWQATVGEKVATKAKPASNYYDIVIIGCGITGSMVAEQVSTLGLKVLVLDRREPASGSTSASTALIQWEIDQPLTSLQKKVGPKKANQSYLASFKAVSTLKRRIQNLQIDCDMIPRSSLLLAGNSMGSIALKREVAARKALKLPSTFLTQTDVKKMFSFDVDGAIVSTGSIEIDPRKLTISLVNIARKNGVEFVAPADVKRIYPTDVGVFI